MSVVYRPPTEQVHECAPPMRCAVYELTERGDPEDGFPRFVRWQPCDGWHEKDGVRYGCANREAAEPIGTIWRCAQCGRYWTVWLPENHPASRIIVAYVPEWRHATWWERRRARRIERADRAPSIL